MSAHHPPHPFTDHTWFSALDAAVARYGSDATAFVAEGPGDDGGTWKSRLTFGGWRAASLAVAAGLAALGVVRSDRVALAAPGGPIWPVLQMACSHLGAVLVPLNVRYRRDEMSHVLDLTRPRVVVALESLRENPIADVVAGSMHVAPTAVLVTFPRSDLMFTAVSAPEEAATTPDRLDWPRFLAAGTSVAVSEPAGRPGDPVLMQFTSGTTAFPKAALLTNAATLGVAFHLGERMGLTDEDVLFGTQPFYHVGGSVGTTLLAPTLGTTLVVPERYRPEEAFRLVPRYRCTARTGQGAMYAMELAHPDFTAEAFRTLDKGWAAGSPELIRRVATEMGLRHVVAIYGLTESSSTATAGSWQDPLDVRAASCGRALPGLELAVDTEEGITERPDQVGEICVRGWVVMAGYYRDADATREAVDGDGWLHTGDLGRLDADGRLHFVDRAKDMIKPGGENVSAAEVERVIASFPGVERAAVVGRPDPRLGEVPVAFVQVVAGAEVDADALIAHCAATMAAFKVPREVVLVDSWPMTESGKVRKPVLRERVRTDGPGMVGASG